MQYKIKGNLKHNGEVLAIGSLVEFSADEAKPLLEMGVIVDPNKVDEDAEVKAPKAKNKKSKVDEDVDDEETDKENTDNETNDGLDELKPAELKKIAKDEDVNISKLKTREEIIAAIREKRTSDDAEQL